MRYLKYFENAHQIFKKVDIGGFEDFASSHKRLKISEPDELVRISILKYRNILNTNKNISHDAFINFNGYEWFTIWTHTGTDWQLLFFDDEYFVLVEKKSNNNYYIVDGWDGLEEAINKLLK